MKIPILGTELELNERSVGLLEKYFKNPNIKNANMYFDFIEKL